MFRIKFTTIGRRSENKHTYIGRRLNGGDGLNYYRHRTFHSQLGRFVSRNPVGYDGSWWNLSEYVGGCPSCGVDPAGFETITLPGTVTIYPPPTGSFDLQIGFVKITDPGDQKQLGDPAKGYVISYNAPKGVCQGPCENLTLTQAWTFKSGIYRYGPGFDGKDDHKNVGRIYPIYDKPMPGVPHSIYDRPFRRSFTHNNWQMTVCAICTTRLVDASGTLAISIERVLGCINFMWEDRKGNPAIIRDGRRYEYPSSEKGIPAVLPTYPWNEAKKNMQAESQ